MRTSQWSGFLFSTSMLVCGSAMAMGTGTHGGQGVMVGTKLCLRDFYEANICERPYFAPKAEYEADVAARVRAGLAIPVKTAELVAQKLLEIKERSPLYGYLAERTLMRYNWVFTDEPLIPMQDGHSVVQGAENTVQIATRKGSRITVYNQAFSQMDAPNQAGVIYHEINYALNDAFSKDDVDSDIARGVTGLLFIESTINVSASRFARTIRDAGLFSGDLLASNLPTSTGMISNATLFSKSSDSGSGLFWDFEDGFATYRGFDIFSHIYESFANRRCLPMALSETLKTMRRTVLENGADLVIDDVVPSYAVARVQVDSPGALHKYCKDNFSNEQPTTKQAHDLERMSPGEIRLGSEN